MQQPLTLILIPGLASDAEMWRDQLAVLPPALNTVVSDDHSRHASLQAMAQALLEEHPGPLVLSGASMGGMVALQAAQLGGERVRGLVLIGTSARPEVPAMRSLREGVLQLLAQGRAAEILRANVPLALAPAHAANPTLAARYLAMLTRAGEAQLIAQNRALMDRPDLRPGLGLVRCATLVVCGALDRLAPVAHSREIADGVLGAELQVLEGCGHMPTMEVPEAVNGVLLAWLGREFG